MINFKNSNVNKVNTIVDFFQTVGGRLLCIPALALLGFLALATVALNALNHSMILDRKERIESVVDIAQSLIFEYHQLEKSGKLTTKDAQNRAMSAIKAIRYNGNEYIWLNDMGTPYPTMIMHPTVPSLDGTVLDNSSFNYAVYMQNRDGAKERNLNNANLFVSAVDVVREYGSGFVQYQWPKPLEGGGVTEQRYPKLSYVALSESWGWVIGSGIYIDDIEDEYWDVAAKIAAVMIIVAFVTVGLSLFIRTWLLNMLGGEVTIAKEIVQQVSSGDFSVSINLNDNDSQSLLFSIGSLVTKLREMLGQQLEIARELASQSEILDQSSQQTKINLQSVMDQTTQVATAVHEMNATCEDMARNATTAAKATRDADDEVKTGSGAVQNTVVAIDALKLRLEQVAQVISLASVRSEEVGTAVDVIGGIAQQTNLLALNAAIEAARAGDKGRGFAVVADEVRALANRSQVSTEHINQSVKGIQADTQQAVQAMKQTTEETNQTIQCSNFATAALQRISISISSITNVNDQLASSTEELAVVSSTINESMLNIADSVGNCSKKSNDLAHASVSLKRMAQHLNSTLIIYKL